MKKVWEEETKLQKMLEVEAALALAETELGMIPKEAAEEINRKKSTEFVKLERVKEIEMATRHDVVSVVKAFAEQCEGDAGEYIHFGSTSNDIIDTAQSLQFKDAFEVLGEKLKT